MSKSKRQIDGTTRNRHPAQSALNVQIVDKPEVMARKSALLEITSGLAREAAIASKHHSGVIFGATTVLDHDKVESFAFQISGSSIIV